MDYLMLIVTSKLKGLKAEKIYLFFFVNIIMLVTFYPKMFKCLFVSVVNGFRIFVPSIYSVVPLYWYVWDPLEKTVL